MNRIKSGSFVLALAFFSNSVLALDGIYLLGAVGQSKTGYPQTTADNAAKGMGVTGLNSSASSTPTAWKLALGYKLNDHLALEASYLDLGKISYNATGSMFLFPVSGSEVVSASVFNFSGVGRHEVSDSFSLLGKLGVARFKSTSQPRGTLAPAFAALGLAQTKTDVSYGIGLEYAMNSNLAVRADWDSFSTGVSAQKQLSIYSLGMVYKF